MPAVPKDLTPTDLRDQVTPGQLSVRGGTVVYTLRRIVGEAERIELWTVPYTGGPARPLTGGTAQPLAGGPVRDTCPRIDRQGRRVGFLRSAGQAPAQLWVMDVDGGGAAAVTGFPRGVTDFDWAPDGSSVVVLAEDANSDTVIRSDIDPDDPSPTAIRLSRIDWRSDGDGDGGLRLYPRHLHAVPLDGRPSARLTTGPWSAARPRVDTDGAVYFLADPSPDADIDPAPQVHCLPGDGSTMRAITALPGGVTRFHLAADGLRILGYPSVGHPDAERPRWYRLPRRASGSEPAEFSEYDEVLAAGPFWTGLLGDETDLHEWHLALDDSADITTVSRDGSTVPVDLATGVALARPGTICGALASDGGARVAVLAAGVAPDSAAKSTSGAGDGAGAARPGWAPDLFALDESGPRRLTRHGAWLDGDGGPRSRRIEIAGPGGPITTFLLEPPESTPYRATILDLHGGPTGQWGAVPPVEAIILASAGYRVAMPNVRGSIDRGADWVAALAGAWGRVDVADVLAVLDALVDRGLAEEGQVGVLGLSYGGFLVQFLVGVTDRFAAAVAENGVANQVSAWAGSDLGPSYNRAAGLGDVLSPAGVAALWDASPLARVARIRTPLLLLQGQDDRTCPASDNEQLFVALRALHRPVEYVIYPEESHLMQATGRWDRRIDRHERVLAWFGTHLAASDAR